MGNPPDVAVSAAPAAPPVKDKVESNDSTAKKHYNNNYRCGREGQKKTEKTTPSTPKQPKFEGKSEDLQGYMYNCTSYKQVDNFNFTTKEITEYVGRTYKYGSDTRLAVTNLAVLTFMLEDSSKIVC